MNLQKLALFFVSAVVLIPTAAAGDDVPRLVKQLGSSVFQQRQSAIDQLKRLPDAVPALKEALKSSDTEIRKHAAEILDFHERRPLREMQEAGNSGLVEKFIESQIAFAPGKYDAE